MEIWDAYNADGSRAAGQLVRGEPIPPGLYHLVADVIVRHTDGDYLLMRRDLAKPNAPGLWEAGASGSVLKGEDPEQGARRELLEETGIQAGALVPLGRRVTGHTIHVAYLCVTDWTKDAITLQPGETIAYRWLGEAELLRFIETDAFVNPQGKRLPEILDGHRGKQ